MRDNRTKQKRIVKAAAALFVEHGFEGTTFLKVSEKSGAAIGSIVHYCADKRGLAAQVYDDTISELAADARAALRSHTNGVEAAVRALLSACLGWDKKFPNYRRLIRMLEPYLTKSKSNRSRWDERPDDLPKVLAEWAELLPRKRKVAPLSPEQLYAVLLAPAMYAGTSGPDLPTDVRGKSIDWLTVLTNAALCALVPTGKKARSPRTRARDGNTAQQDLLG